MAPRRPSFRLPRRSARQLDTEVDEEIRFHLEARAEQLRRQGLDEEGARSAAAERFGNLEETRRALRESTRRREGRMRRKEWLEQIAQDVGYAVRQLRRQPGFAAVAVLTLSVGIAANAVMFGIVDRLLLRPPAHVVDPDAVHRVYFERRLPDGSLRTNAGVSYFRYTELRDATRSVAEVAAFSSRETVVGRGSDAEEVQAVHATASLFPLLGVRPALGRFFDESEDTPPRGATVAVLGHGYWQRRFGGDPAALGEVLRVDGSDFTIIGVAPPEFGGVELREGDLWLPATSINISNLRLRDDWATRHNFTWLSLVTRPRPDVPADQARVALDVGYSQSLAAQEGARPLSEIQPRVLLSPVLRERGPDRSASSRVSVWLLGVAVVVLVVACANVANLLLARALRRRREIAVRLALGISRRRLVGQFLIESLLLALAAAAIGLLLTQWVGAVLRSVLLPNATWSGPLHDPRVLAFTTLAAVLAGLVAGVVPAIQASRPDVTDALRAGLREGAGRRSWVGAALLTAQAALSVLLLVGAGLFVRSLQEARGTDLGFEPDALVLATIDYRGSRPDSLDARLELDRRLLDRVRALPWVERATTSLALPFQRNMTTILYDEERDSIPGSGNVFVTAVGTDYFETMGTRIVRGRDFGAEDRFGAAPVMIVSETMARTVWPGRAAIGECVRFGREDPCATIVGVARDIAQGELAADSVPQLWIPEAQRQANYAGAWAYLARVRGDPSRSVATIRRALLAELPPDAYADVRPMRELVDPHLRSWRLGATMFVAFGALSLLIAAVGLYGVIAYHVSQRTHELGVRQALGARGRDLLRAVLGEGLRLTAAGLVIGTLLALAASRWVAPLLYGVSARDPVTYVAVVVVLLVASTAACLIPARRAATVAPSEALRAD